MCVHGVLLAILAGLDRCLDRRNPHVSVHHPVPHTACTTWLYVLVTVFTRTPPGSNPDLLTGPPYTPLPLMPVTHWASTASQFLVRILTHVSLHTHTHRPGTDSITPLTLWLHYNHRRHDCTLYLCARNVCIAVPSLPVCLSVCRRDRLTLLTCHQHQEGGGGYLR